MHMHISLSIHICVYIYIYIHRTPGSDDTETPGGSPEQATGTCALAVFGCSIILLSLLVPLSL